MGEKDLRVAALPQAIREPVWGFGDRVISDLGEDLESITIVGSSLTADFNAGRSDINTVLVLGGQTPRMLNKVALLARPMRRKCFSAPLVMTRSYIARSRDVFGVEFLDFQQTHATILGEDPFVGLSFEKKNVRLQCERELKAAVVRLRQGYIAAAGHKRLVRDVLISTSKGMAPLLRALLWLTNRARPDTAQGTFSAAAATLGVGTEALATAAGWRHRKVRLGKAQLESAFEAVYTAVDKLAVMVDELEV